MTGMTWTVAKTVQTQCGFSTAISIVIAAPVRPSSRQLTRLERWNSESPRYLPISVAEQMASIVHIVSTPAIWPAGILKRICSERQVRLYINHPGKSQAGGSFPSMIVTAGILKRFVPPAGRASRPWSSRCRRRC